MTEDGTEPIASPAGELVRVVRVTVVTGPDTGASQESAAPLSVGSAAFCDVQLGDPTVSRFHLEVARAGGRILVADQGSTNGTWIGEARLDGSSATVPAGTTLQIGATKIRVDDGGLAAVEEGLEQFGELFGRAPVMRRLFSSASKVARSDVPVLVLGESGTGKELLARAIHDNSSRRQQPFVTVDCAAIPPGLFASELFGHERGAFTGANRQHEGAFERASGGTLFLDELGELPGELQAALLGALERRRIQRVGGRQQIAVDVRLVSATHRDLIREVNAGSFRLDLFYRLAVVRLTLPPLRERTDDIPELVARFATAAGYAGASGELFPETELSRLRQHHWPGNVRELRNVVLGTLALGTPPEIPALVTRPTADPILPILDLPYRDAKRELLEQFERRYVEHQLQKSGGVVRQAARDAKMDRSHLIELMKRHGLRSGG